MAVIYDPNVFLQPSAQRNRERSKVFESIANAFQRNQELKAAQAEQLRKEAIAEASQQAQFAQQEKLLGMKQAGTPIKPEQRLVQLATIAQQRPLTPQEMAEYKGIEQVRGTQQIIGAMGDVAPKYSPLSLAGQTLMPPPAEAPMGAEPLAQPSPLQREAQPISEFQKATEGVGGSVRKTPKFEMERGKQELQFESTKLMKQFEAGQAKKLTDKQKASSQQIIDRMRQINKELKDLGEISSESQGMMQRGTAALAGTGVGQAVEKVTDPKSQALRDEYKKLQSTFLPFYATAAGLGAKSLDSEGERKSILDSFGDPAGLYEANERQLENLTNLIGTGGQSTTNTDPRIKKALDAGYTMEEINQFLGKK